MGRTVTKVVERCSRAAYNEDQLRRPHHLYRDNLDILRGLNFASVDPIYLDPPFDSNRKDRGMEVETDGLLWSRDLRAR